MPYLLPPPPSPLLSSGVSAPSGLLAARLIIPAAETDSLNLSVVARGTEVLSVSNLGLDLAEGGALSSDLRVLGTKSVSRDSTWKSIAGKTSRVRDHYRETTYRLEERHGARRRLDLIVRAYDEGIAFRYLVPKQAGITRFDVREELTAFKTRGNPTATALVLPNERTPYEEPYKVGPLSTMNGVLIGFPLMLTQSGNQGIAFTEADLNDYPGLYLRPESGTLRGHLSPRLDDSGFAVKASLPHRTPWRVVMVGDPKRLLESNLVLNLNPPSAIKDTSWIKPGKTVFPWWNGYNTGSSGVAPAQTTEYHKWCIDFAARRGIPYHSIDGLDNIAWYGGRIVPYDGGPLTKGLPGLNLEEIVRYAKTKGVRIRLWMASAASRAQMAVAFPYYQRLGIEGVMVDFFDRDDQETVNYVHQVVALAAKCHLTITLHNIYKPTGLERTYPNLLGVEAARNLEFDKWDPVGITPEHEINVAYVRALAGPIDFHAGSFRNAFASDFKPVDKAPMTIGTRARQLARYVVYEDGLNMIADSPAVYDKDDRGLDFLVKVPTTWDETRIIAGEFGQWIAVARRKGRDWYLGGMTDGQARKVEVRLEFLGSGKFRMDSWSDVPGATATEVAIVRRDLTGKRPLILELAASGGAAMRFISQ